MKNIFYRRDGQVAPFMIAVIVVLLMAIMVTVNIGKVGVTKTHTANAADAGALAGSAMHANTLNSLAYTNTSMIAEYAATEILFVVSALIELEMPRFLTYWAFVVAQTSQFILAWYNADKAYKGASNAAKQFAFMNAGIDEPKKRLPGESYQDYLNRDSNFGIWMKNKGYESGYYSWADNDGQENSFRVDVEAPDFPGLIPMPGAFVSLYFKWIPMCTNCGYVPCCNCALCNAAAAQFNYSVSQANRKTLGSILSSVPITTGFTPVAFTSSGVVVPPFCPCGSTFAWAIVLYYIPVVSIAGIVEDNPEITVTTTRVEPGKDLGLWQMQYGTVSSQAKAKSSGGSVGPVPSTNYDTELIAGGY